MVFNVFIEAWRVFLLFGIGGFGGLLRRLAEGALSRASHLEGEGRLYGWLACFGLGWCIFLVRALDILSLDFIEEFAEFLLKEP